MWFCEENCLENAESFFQQLPNSTIADLNVKIDKLVTGFAELKLQKDNEEAILDKKIEEKVKMILIEERKLNLLVFGLPEAATDSTELERKGNDIMHLRDVITELKIETDVSNLTRIGRQKDDDGHNFKRPLRFSVKDTLMKDNILKGSERN